MAGVTNREFWGFRVKTRAQFTKLAEQIANIDTSGGGGISELTSKMVVDALGYTPYNANNPANYITSAALAPYALTTDIPSLAGYATEDFVNNQLEDYATQDYVATKLVDYAPLTSVQGFENRIGGLEGAVPRLNARVETVESKVATLNEYVVTGDNNLLNRVNVIEQEYATKTYVDNAIDGIDLSPYLKTEDAKETYATKDFVNNKLINYATIGSVTAIQNTLTGQIGAVNASVEQLATTKLDSSYFTLTNIKSTLGISDWALAATKPTYTASEVGALRLNESSANADLDTILDSKIAELKPFFQALTTNDVGSARKGVLRISYNGSESQLLFDHYNRLLRYRTIGENPRNWATIAFTSDIPTKLSQLTDDVVAGKYLRATIYGNFDADTLFNDGFQSGYLSHLPSGQPYGIVHTLSYRGVSNNAKPDYAAQIFIPCGDDNTSPNDMFFRTSLLDSWNGWTKVITDRNIKDQYVAGVYDSYNPLMKITFKYAGGGVTSNPAWLACWNDYTLTYVSPDNVKAGSATKLATPCKLWGQRFDGTGDVSGSLDVSGNIKADGNINATSITINGVTITASNGSITVNGNVFAKGDITGGV